MPATSDHDSQGEPGLHLIDQKVCYWYHHARTTCGALVAGAGRIHTSPTARLPNCSRHRRPGCDLPHPQPGLVREHPQAGSCLRKEEHITAQRKLHARVMLQYARACVAACLLRAASHAADGDLLRRAPGLSRLQLGGPAAGHRRLNAQHDLGERRRLRPAKGAISASVHHEI